MTRDEAITIIAKTVIAELIQEHAEYKWDDHPEIGEYAWEQVLDRLDEIAGEVNSSAYDTAVRLLAGDEDDE